MNTELFADLASRSQAGDREAMEQLLLMAHTPVSYQCRKILQNDRAAETLTKEILALIHTQLDSLSDPNDFEKWMCRVTAARCMKTLNRLRRDNSDETPVPPENIQIPRQTLDEVQTAQVIQQIADHLPEETRLCLLLYCCGGLEFGGIARLTGFTEASVVEHLNRAQGIINNHLRKYHKMGIRFARIRSLPELLCTAMYHSGDPGAAAVLVDDLLGKKAPASAVPRRRRNSATRRLIAAAMAAAILLLILLAAIAFLELNRMAG